MSEAQLDAEVERLEGLIAENGRILAEAGGRGIVILPGAAELLRDLREKGARFGIVTSGQSHLPAFTRELGENTDRIYHIFFPQQALSMPARL